jgi:predicted AAA+ superfamily ATPase
MYIKRNLEDKILKFVKAPEIIAITGPRQAGKTTLMNRVKNGLQKAVFVSFEDREVLRMFEKNTDDFVKIYVKANDYLFIDEFQYAKNGGKILKYIFDSQKIKIIISGSSSADLTVRAIKYLVGRVLIFDLYPFDFREFLAAKDANYFKMYAELKKEIGEFKGRAAAISAEAHKKLMDYYEEYLIFGGYPRVVLEENYESKKEILKNIYNTYFLREVRDILGLIDDFKLGTLIKSLALQIGNLIEYRELTRLSGYSYVFLKKYLNFLKKTYICNFIKPFFRNKRTEIVKNPKVYFLDTGLRNFIVNDFRKLNNRTDKGALLENGLAQQFIKEGKELNFWRDKKKNEIDFIVSLGDGKTVAIESKSFLKDGYSTGKVFKKKYPEAEIYLSYQEIAENIKEKKNIYPAYLY